MSPLDLYSTSATKERLCSPVSIKPFCEYHAPLICFPQQSGIRETWMLIQGCCNHWDCPRCGIIRAKREYWRIVGGATKLEEQGSSLFFITITCKGRELKVKDSEEKYLEWTKKLNDNMRVHAKRTGQEFAYAAVTERQKRGHPHSHYLTTFKPNDSAPYAKLTYKRVKGQLKMVVSGGANEKHAVHFMSDWFEKSIENAGLGRIYDISQVKSAAGVSRYIAKYLFKETLHTVWPLRWKRVRYSGNWPTAETFQSDERAFAIIENSDWKKVRELGETVRTDDLVLYEMAKHRDVNNVKLLTTSKKEV